MMNAALRCTVGLWTIGCPFLTGCALDAATALDERLGETEDAIINTNSLDLAAGNLDGIQLSPLRPDTLPSDAAAAIQDPGKTGDMARRMLRHLVECALPATTSFDFTWADATGAEHAESYAGLIDLAPGWAHAPATPEEQSWVSACLISKANRYGATVLISSRGSEGALPTFHSAELADYKHLEGAFWGEVFASPPVAYSCTNLPEQPYAISQQRECASGIPAPPGVEDGCGYIQMVGSCEVLCSAFDSKMGYYSDCAVAPGAPGTGTSRVVTVHLH